MVRDKAKEKGRLGFLTTVCLYLKKRHQIFQSLNLLKIYIKYILYVYLGSGTKKARRMARVYVISL